MPGVTYRSVMLDGIGFAWLVVTSLVEKTPFLPSETSGDLARLASVHPSKNKIIAPIAAPTLIPAFAPDDKPSVEADVDGIWLEVGDVGALLVEVDVNEVDDTSVDKSCAVLDD